MNTGWWFYFWTHIRVPGQDTEPHPFTASGRKNVSVIILNTPNDVIDKWKLVPVQTASTAHFSHSEHAVLYYIKIFPWINENSLNISHVVAVLSHWINPAMIRCQQSNVVVESKPRCFATLLISPFLQSALAPKIVWCLFRFSPVSRRSVSVCQWNSTVSIFLSASVLYSMMESSRESAWAFFYCSLACTAISSNPLVQTPQASQIVFASLDVLKLARETDAPWERKKMGKDEDPSGWCPICSWNARNSLMQMETINKNAEVILPYTKDFEAAFSLSVFEPVQVSFWICKYCV